MEQQKLTPQFFFVTVGTLIALIVCVTSLLRLTFETLNRVLPDVLTDSYQYGYASYSYENMRTAIAILLIVLPVYFVLEYFSLKLSRKKLSHWDEVLRRWATYLVLFLASIAVIVDLVLLVQYFVSGEITLRFILKVAAVCIVAGSIGYYHVRKLQLVYDGVRLFAIAAGAVALALIVWAFTVMGSPMNQRNLRLDQRRVNDLQSIQWQVISYWQQKERLPETLTELSTPISSYMVPVDPEFQKGKAYEYEKTGDKSFRLCATFTLPMPEGFVPGYGAVTRFPMMDTTSSMPYPGGAEGESWKHEAGRTCFDRTIDPELYPPFSKAQLR